MFLSQKSSTNMEFLKEKTSKEYIKRTMAKYAHLQEPGTDHLQTESGCKRQRADHQSDASDSESHLGAMERQSAADRSREQSQTAKED